MFSSQIRKVCSARTSRIQLKVNYRIKNDLKIEKAQAIKISHLNEHQIKRIFKWKNLSSRKYELLLRSLETYEGLGFKLYQMVESSKSLLMQPSEILQQHKLLCEVCPRAEISIPILKQASEGGRVCGLTRGENQDGSDYEKLMKALKCSEDEFVRMLIKNPRLCGTSRMLNLIPKVELLLRNGVDVEMIKKNSFILNNQPYEVIESRLEKLKALKMDIPINLGTLNRTEEVFQNIYNHLSNKESTLSFNKCLSILSKLPKVNKKSLYFQKRKVDMLLKKGFSETEIIEQGCNIDQSFEQLTALLEFSDSIKAPSFPPPPLKLVLIGENEPSHESSSLLFIKSLDVVCDCRLIERHPAMINKQHINNNLKFLQQHGFTNFHLSQLPFLLCYPPEYVSLAWQDILSDPKVHLKACNQGGEKVKKKKKKNLKSALQNDASNNNNSGNNLDVNISNSGLNDDEKVRLLNVLQFKLEMLPLSEIMGGNGVDGGVDLTINDGGGVDLTINDGDGGGGVDSMSNGGSGEREGGFGVYDILEGSPLKSEGPIDLYISERDDDGSCSSKVDDNDGNDDGNVTDNGDNVTDNDDSVTDNGDNVTDNDDSVTDNDGNVTDNDDSVTDNGDNVTDNGDNVTDNGDSVSDNKVC